MFRAINKRRSATMPSQEKIDAALEWLTENGPVDYVLRYGDLELDWDGVIPDGVEVTLDRINMCDQDLRPTGLKFEIHSYEDWGLPGTVSYVKEKNNDL